MITYDFGVLATGMSDKYCRLCKCLALLLILLSVISPNLAHAATCSSYKGKVTINEYNYIDNYVELKIIDPAIVTSSNTFNGWTLDLYSGNKNTLGTPVSSGYQSTASGLCSVASNTYLPFKYGSNEIDGTGIVVLKDDLGNEVDYFRLSGTGSYPNSPASSCSAFPYPTNGPLNINSGKKGILRYPDGTGNWIIGQGNGNNSEKSPCGSNDSLLSITNTPNSSVVGIGVSSPFTWTVVLTNGGNNSLSGVQIVNEIPTGMVLVSCSPSCSGQGTIANPYVIDVGALAAGASYTATMTTYVTAVGSYTNDIGVTATELFPSYGHGIATVNAINASGFDHVRLNHTGSGVTCTGSQVTVNRCSSADSSGSCVPYTPNSALTGNVLVKNSGGTTIATIPFTVSANSSSATVSVPVTTATAQPVTLSVSNLSHTPVNAQTCWNGTSASCSHVYSDAGFIIVANLANDVMVTIPPQIAGIASSTYYLRAVKTNTTTKACEAALTGSQSVNFAYECNNPITCSASDLMSINAITVARNNNGSVSNYAPVSMTFDANGNAPFTFNYTDVGLIKLYANKTAGGTLLTTLTGSSNAFVVKPSYFDITNIQRTSDNFANPAAAAANDAKFIKTGNTFTSTVTAMNAFNNATPNFGKETSAEGVKLTHNLFSPSGGVTGNLSNGAIAGTSFNNGAATVNNLAWSEVGIITLTPSVADGDYLGAGDVTGTTSVNIGRFYPDHFTVTGSINNRKDLVCTPASTFTYMDEPLQLALTLTAQNASDGVTQNYTTANGFAKLDATDPWLTLGSNRSFGAGAIDVTTTTPLSPRLLLDNTPSGTWNAGINDLTANFKLSKPTSTTPDSTWGAYENVKLGVAPQDADGVSASAFTLDADNNGSNERVLIGNSKFRYGRIALQNAYGSELLPLTIPLETQYWNGNYYAINGNDSCTVIPASSIIMSNYRNNLNACETQMSPTGSLVITAGKLSGGLNLTPSGSANTGSVELTVNVSNTAVNKTCLSATESNATAANMPWFGTTTAQATFGIYKGNDKVIYFRELY